MSRSDEIDSDRDGAIIRLLRTRDEHLPEPIHRSQGAAGFVHRAPARVSCPDCLANDRSMFGCETCGGRGYTEEHRERDPYAIDVVVPYGLSPDRREACRSRDRQIDILEEQLRPASTVDEIADANAHPYGWERARKQMYRLFDYAALDRALEALWQIDAEAFGALRAAGACSVVDGWRALAFLSDHLPAELRVPASHTGKDEVRIVGKLGRAAGRRALDMRDAEICHSVLDAKIPTADVARSWGISISQVNKIIQAAA